MRLLRRFLSRVELADLKEMASNATYEPGRQRTGYEKSALPPFLGTVVKARAERALEISENEWWFREKLDCYFIRYPEGSFIPKHLDDAPLATEHHRINAMLTNADEGGEGVDSPIVLRLIKVLVTKMSLAEGLPLPPSAISIPSEGEPSKASSGSETTSPDAPPAPPAG